MPPLLVTILFTRDIKSLQGKAKTTTITNEVSFVISILQMKNKIPVQNAKCRPTGLGLHFEHNVAFSILKICILILTLLTHSSNETLLPLFTVKFAMTTLAWVW